jgi:hypothetical protein
MVVGYRERKWEWQRQMMEGKGGIGGSALPGVRERRQSRVGASRGGGDRWAASMDSVTGGNDTWGDGSIGEER